MHHLPKDAISSKIQEVKEINAKTRNTIFARVAGLLNIMDNKLNKLCVNPTNKL
jgi:hypothetical protein